MRLERRVGIEAGSVLAIFGAMAAVGVAFWLLPASVHIVSWTRRAERVAVFVPQYMLTRILVAAVAVAVGLTALSHRRRDGVARLATVLAPLNLLWLWTLPFLPWLGDRLPLLLVLAGPIRWGIAALALGGLATRAVRGRMCTWLTTAPGRRTVFVLSLALYLTFGLRSLGTVGLGGDEPHYLVISHSLLADHDLQIENNHTRGDYRAFFGGTLRPDYLQRGLNEAIYSIHAPGLSALLLPGYAVAGAKGAVMTAALIAALAATAVFGLGVQLAGMGGGWIIWAFVCLTVPFVPHAWALYPEIAGAAIVAWSLLWWAANDGDEGRVRWFWRGLGLSVLPWLHTKFSVLLAGFVVMFVWKLRARWRSALAMLTPVAIVGVTWLGFFYLVYGSLDPQAPYGGYTAQFIRFSNMPRSVLGMLFDQKFGLLVYAPIYAFIAVGLWIGRRQPALVVPGALAVVYALSSARLYMWWGGASAPARFLVPVLPLLVPALAQAVVRARRTWWTAGLAVCALLSLAIATVGVLDARELLLFSSPHGFARMVQLVQGSAPLMSALPTFTEENWLVPLSSLLPWCVAAGVAVAVARLCARFGSDRVWVAPGGVTAFLIGGALFASSFSPDVRAESSRRGTQALLQAFDPIRARAFDYAQLTRLTPAAWLSRATLTVDHRPGDAVDRQGRVTDALALPAGRYVARVWFDGGRPRAGAIEAIAPGGSALTRIDGPLPNPSELDLDLPVAAPTLWVRATDPESARGVRRVELSPREVFAHDRQAAIARVVEPLAARLGAYVAYVDHNTFPEGGVFWTRGTERGAIVVVPAGSPALELTLHVGPTATGVSLWIGDQRQELTLQAEETRTVRVPLQAGRRILPIAVQAHRSFVPAQVDTRSTDMRQLGCQVRIGLE